MFVTRRYFLERIEGLKGEIRYLRDEQWKLYRSNQRLLTKLGLREVFNPESIELEEIVPMSLKK